MSEEAPKRRFTLLDGLVLLAATAIGLGGCRAFLDEAQRVYDSPGFLTLPATFHIQSAASVLVALTVALPLLGLFRRAALPFRRSARQPGFAAALAVCFFTAIKILEILRDPLMRRFPRIPWVEAFSALIRDLASYSGLLVAALWFVMLLGHRWRLRGDWVEAVARVVSVCWIAEYVALKFR
jgi:hypothetical protein